MSKLKENLKRIRLWQIMVFVLLILTILFMGSSKRQNAIIVQQQDIIQELENTLAAKNAKVTALSNKLLAVMGQLKSAVVEINQ